VSITNGQKIIDLGIIPLGTAARFEIAKLRLKLAQSDLASAKHLESCLDEGTDTHNFNRFTNLTKAKFLLAMNKRDQAAWYLAELAQKAKKNGWQYALIAILCWQAVSAQSRQDAIAFLREALQLAKPEGFMRIFVDLGVDLIPFLQEAARSGIEPDYVGQILDALQNESGYKTQNIRLVEPLSDREMEVLRLIVAGLSNRQIAQDLVISLGTAKTHIHNIYSKLDVSNRAQAIARAREFELV
jgi:LuxR family maltose regulon positive regulatory protein